MTLSLLKNKQKVKDATPRAASSADSINEIGQGEGLYLRWLIGGALFIIPFVLLVLYYRAQFAGLLNDGALDFAQLGRNLSAGRGFTTFFLRPLALTHGANPLRQPDMTHGPLYPVVLALAFGALGAKDTVAAGVSGLFYVLTVPVLYLLGVRLFSRNVGLLAALVFAANPMMLEYGISGLPITFYTFLTTGLMLVLHQIGTASSLSAGDVSIAPTPLPKTPFILAGLLTGALYLTDPLFIWFAPVVLAAVITLSGTQRVSAILRFLLPFCLVALPWMLRNLTLTGNPIFGLRGLEIWMDTKGFYPGEVAYRYAPSDLTPGGGLFQSVLRKVLFYAAQIVKTLPQIGAGWMIGFLLPSLLFRFKDNASNTVRRVMGYCLLALAVGMLPMTLEVPMFACLVPVMLVFAAGYLMHLVGQAQLPRPSVALLASVIGAVLLLPLIQSMVLTDKPQGQAALFSAKSLQQMVGPKETILTDQPALVAWHADRPAVWIPAVDSKVGDVRKQFPGTRWLFLTEQTRGLSPQWAFLYNAMGQWNQTYIQAKNSGMAEPPPATLSGSASPLIESLDGFTILPPAAGAPATVVIAAVPK